MQQDPRNSKMRAVGFQVVDVVEVSAAGEAMQGQSGALILLQNPARKRQRDLSQLRDIWKHLSAQAWQLP
jgi:hypothetical protein